MKLIFPGIIILLLNACAGQFIKPAEPMPAESVQAEPTPSTDIVAKVDTSQAAQDSIEVPAEPQVNYSDLKTLHFKVQFKTKSLLKLSDFDSVQVQVLNNYQSALFWMNQLLEKESLTQEQVSLMTVNLNQIRNSLYQINELKTPVEDTTSQEDGYAAVQATLDSLKPKEPTPTPNASWDGRFNEISNLAKAGYSWKQVKEPLAQIERSSMGPALAQQILDLKTMVQKRDRKEITDLVFELESDLTVAKLNAAQLKINTLREDYPDYLDQIDMARYEQKLSQLNKNLQVEPADSTVASSQDSAQIPVVQVSPEEAQAKFKRVDILLESEKWLEARDALRPWINSNVRDQVSARIFKASEAFCQERRSEAAKHMARSRGRGRSRQKSLFQKALVELESCSQEFPGSDQAKTVQDNIDMLKSRL